MNSPRPIKLLVHFYNHRFEPLVEALKNELERGAIGRVYHGRLFYGNGTVANVMGSWRDEGLGVVEDLGSLHRTSWVTSLGGCEMENWTVERHEAMCPDHCILATAIISYRTQLFVVEERFCHRNLRRRGLVAFARFVQVGAERNRRP